MSPDFDVVEFLRSHELAAYETWRATAWNDPLLHVRGDKWLAALRALNAEMKHRFSHLTRPFRTSGIAVRTSGIEVRP
jgi:hypothetical protein